MKYLFIGFLLFFSFGQAPAQTLDELRLKLKSFGGRQDASKLVVQIGGLPSGQRKEIFDKLAVIAKEEARLRFDPKTHKGGGSLVRNVAILLKACGDDDAIYAAFGDLASFGSSDQESAADALRICSEAKAANEIAKATRQALLEIPDSSTKNPTTDEIRAINKAASHFLILLKTLNDSRNVAGPKAAEEIRSEVAHKNRNNRLWKSLLEAIDSEIPPPTADSAFKNGKVLTREEIAGQFQWLARKDVVLIDFEAIKKKHSKLRKESFHPISVNSREEAYILLNENVNIAVGPTCGFEGAEFYYFSGGRSTEKVSDFSSGYGVSKATGEIIYW